jgi:putative FmdB family regulatory protein
MPIYEYRCDDGHRFEVMQSMTDDPVPACRVCSKPVQRVFHPVAVHFKGSGFYSTDYGRGGRSGDGGKADSSPGAGDDSKSKSEDKSGGKSESKDASKSTAAESKSGSGD